MNQTQNIKIDGQTTFRQQVKKWILEMAFLFALLEIVHINTVWERDLFIFQNWQIMQLAEIQGEQGIH